MSVCVVDLQVRAGAAGELARVFTERFRPAITGQPGFVQVELLRPGQGSRWLLLIRFTDEPARLAWVDTDLHQQVWPLVEQHCDRADTTLFEPVE